MFAVQQVFFHSAEIQGTFAHTTQFFQLQTYMCYSRLQQRCQQPCQFCGQEQHREQCHVLLHLAVHLTHGLGIRGLNRHRFGFECLGQAPDSGAVGSYWTTHSSEGQEATYGPQCPRNPSRRLFHGADPKADTPGDDSTAVEARGCIEWPATGIPVPDSPDSRCGEHFASAVEADEGLACSGGETHDIAPLSGQVDGGGTPEPTAYAGGGLADGRPLPGLHEVPPAEERPGSHHAIPEVECQGETTASHGPTWSSSSLGAEEPGQHSQADGRPTSHTEISCTGQAEGRGSVESGAISVDRFNAKLTGTVARNLQVVLSQYLATYPGQSETTDFGQTAARQESHAQEVIHIPIMLNSTGTACFANSVVLCIAWMNLLSGGMQRRQVSMGFELLRNVYRANHIPMDLINFAPFQWLLFGDWSVGSFRRQQDACEFANHMLQVMCPEYLHCGWVTRPALLAPTDEDDLMTEKGLRFSPIRLAFPEASDTNCALQTLIDLWHDSQGLCRAVEKVGYHAVLEISRYNPETHQKCTQQILQLQHPLRLPCFRDQTGTIQFVQFQLCALIFHIGTSPTQGHYRAALREGSVWYVYEDGQVPDRTDFLSEFIQSNVTLIWLRCLDFVADRTIDTDPSFRTIRSTATDDA